MADENPKQYSLSASEKSLWRGLIFVRHLRILTSGNFYYEIGIFIILVKIFKKMPHNTQNKAFKLRAK